MDCPRQSCSWVSPLVLAIWLGKTELNECFSAYPIKLALAYPWLSALLTVLCTLPSINSCDPSLKRSKRLWAWKYPEHYRKWSQSWSAPSWHLTWLASPPPTALLPPFILSYHRKHHCSSACYGLGDPWWPFELLSKSYMSKVIYQVRMGRNFTVEALSVSVFSSQKLTVYC